MPSLPPGNLKQAAAKETIIHVVETFFKKRYHQNKTKNIFNILMPKD